MNEVINFVQANYVGILAVLALLVRLEMAVAKLTKTTKDDVIGQKVADALKNLGVDATKPQ